MSTSQARATVFRIAGLEDDGRRTVKSAYRTASRKLHPDTGSTPEQEELFKLLSMAKSVLDKAKLFT
jgi:DnaJ-class molecular chaperone